MHRRRPVPGKLGPRNAERTHTKRLAWLLGQQEPTSARGTNLRSTTVQCGGESKAQIVRGGAAAPDRTFTAVTKGSAAVARGCDGYRSRGTPSAVR